MLYSECHHGKHYLCLHSLKFTSDFVSSNLWLIVESFVSFAQFTLIVELFVNYQPSCQGVTFVSPSPPWVGHLAEITNLCLINSLKFFRSCLQANNTQAELKYSSSYKQQPLCSPKLSRTSSKSFLKTTLPLGLKSIQNYKTFRARPLPAFSRATRKG